jgi:hypothetical protein
MGRKKSEPPKHTDSRVTVIALKGSPEYRDWLGDLSKRSRIPTAVIVDLALADWAKKNEMPPPPDR